MIKIFKKNEPDEFTEWKQKYPEATFRGKSSLSGKDKKVVQNALILEQGYVCCYCGIRISSIADGAIEHIIPISEDGRKQLDYNNMGLSCLAAVGRPKSHYQHCDAFKGDKLLPITPYEDGCNDHFWFTEEGQIACSSDDTEGIETIKVLNLNAGRLQNMRRETLKGIKNFCQSIDGTTEEGQKQISEIAEKFAKRDADGRFEPFFFVILSYLGVSDVYLTYNSPIESN